jgi:plasmid stability protein
MTNLFFIVETRFVLHYFRVMKNVTITLDEEVARWARIRAAENNTSVSRLVGEMLREKMLAEKSYPIAMDHYLSQPPEALKDPAAKYPTRKELYGR